jgi:hypothetical protein
VWVLGPTSCTKGVWVLAPCTLQDRGVGPSTLHLQGKSEGPSTLQDRGVDSRTQEEGGVASRILQEVVCPHST